VIIFNISADIVNMEDSANFTETIGNAIAQKTEHFNSSQLPKLLDNYRLLFTCVKNLYDFLSKKSLITPDPYAVDSKVTDIEIPSIDNFNENDAADVIGDRLSRYKTMLDFLCSYYKFNTENLTISKIRKLQGFNEVFLWDNMSINNAKINTRVLATIISNSKKNTPPMTLSLINDSLEKSSRSMIVIRETLAELAAFQRESFKLKIRKDVIGSSKFDKSKAFSSPNDEFDEIKRLYPEIISKKGFPNELVQEIVNEDQSPKKEKYQSDALARLSVKADIGTKKKNTVNTKDILMFAVFSLGGMAPTLAMLQTKLTENFEVLFTKKKSLGTMIGTLFKKLFNLKDKEKVIDLPIKNPRNNQITHQKVKVAEFMQNLEAKVRLFNAIAAKGAEYSKIEASKEDVILPFLNKQISDVQSIYTLIDALDDFMKQSTENDPNKKLKIKGMKIEISALKGSIIAANKKRGEYASLREEIDQMRKLGVTEDV